MHSAIFLRFNDKSILELKGKQDMLTISFYFHKFKFYLNFMTTQIYTKISLENNRYSFDELNLLSRNTLNEISLLHPFIIYIIPLLPLFFYILLFLSIYILLFLFHFELNFSAICLLISYFCDFFSSTFIHILTYSIYIYIYVYIYLGTSALKEVFT